MGGGGILSPGCEMAVKTTVTQVYPVLSPLPSPGKTMFPRFPLGLPGAAVSRVCEDVACGNACELV